MNLNNIIPLSYNIADGKRRYVLFCGAGISRDAGIPTGWDILLETLKKIRNQEKSERKDYSIKEMEKFYEENFKELTYSEVLESLFPSIEEQRAFLKEQFQDISFGKSHKLIAEWVKEGLIRFIVTTNFDSLLEQALDDAGLRGRYSVISSGEQVLTSKPWNNVEICRIYKIHGTIEQGKIRNTRKDLIEIDNDLEKDLLDILERHGVIVLGYAGNDEDKAVMNTFNNRRFKGYTLYWTIHKNYNDKVKQLIEKQDGHFLKITGASDFLEEVLNRVEIARTGVEQTPKSVSQKRFKNLVINPPSDVIIKQTINEEKSKVVTYIKEVLNEVNENDYNSLWEGYVKIFNYSFNFLILIELIIEYQAKFWENIIPIFEEIHLLNKNQGRYGKDGLINYIFYTLFEMTGGILLKHKSFICLNQLLKLRRLNHRKDGLENILDWNNQADFIEIKNDKEKENKWIFPKLHYLIQLLESQDISFEWDIKENILDVDLLFFAYSVIYSKGQYSHYWYPRSAIYRDFGSDAIKMIKLDEQFGAKVSNELFEMEYDELIEKFKIVKAEFEKLLASNHHVFMRGNPFNDL